MPSRRQLLAALGSAATVGFAGRASRDATTGTVTRKSIGVGHLHVRAASPPDHDPDDVTITQFDLDERLARE